MSCMGDQPGESRPYDHIYKIILEGPSEAGKTSIRKCATGGAFDPGEVRWPTRKGANKCNAGNAQKKCPAPLTSVSLRVDLSGEGVPTKVHYLSG
jgi:hypothetical protein